MIRVAFPQHSHCRTSEDSNTSLSCVCLRNAQAIQGPRFRGAAETDTLSLGEPSRTCAAAHTPPVYRVGK
eukprot:IDg13649t1